MFGTIQSAFASLRFGTISTQGGLSPLNKWVEQCEIPSVWNTMAASTTSWNTVTNINTNWTPVQKDTNETIICQ